jgi:hypothetical protein
VFKKDVISKVKKIFIANRAAGFVFFCIIATAIFRMNTTSFDPSYLSFMMPDVHHSQVFEQTIAGNPDIFGQSPLRNVELLNQSVNHGTGGAVSISGIYRLLSFHPSWILNTVLTHLIMIGQFSAAFAGAIIATTLYSAKKVNSEERRSGTILIKQVLAAASFVLLSIIVLSIVGTIAGHILHSTRIQDSVGFQFILNWHEVLSIWTPGVGYYAMALVGTFVFLLSATVFGIFVGHVIKNTGVALVFLFFLGTFFPMLLFFVPISPMFFMQRIIPHFILSDNFFMTVGDSNLWLNLAYLLLFLTCAMFISKKIIDFRLRTKVTPESSTPSE